MYTKKQYGDLENACKLERLKRVFPPSRNGHALEKIADIRVAPGEDVPHAATRGKEQIAADDAEHGAAEEGQQESQDHAADRYAVLLEHDDDASSDDGTVAYEDSESSENEADERKIAKEVDVENESESESVDGVGDGAVHYIVAPNHPLLLRINAALRKRKAQHPEPTVMAKKYKQNIKE